MKHKSFYRKVKRVYGGTFFFLLRKMDHLEDLGSDGRMILKWILEKWNGKASGPGYGQVASSCECSDEPSGSIQCAAFLG